MSVYGKLKPELKKKLLEALTLASINDNSKTFGRVIKWIEKHL